MLAALSLAADLGVGLPAEHAVRSCYLGMHVADQLQLSVEQRAELYYAELLMDAGCTAWTSHLAASIISDEIAARREFYFFTDASNPLDVLRWLKDYMGAGAPIQVRAQQLLNFALHGRERAREGFRNTCDVARRFAHRLGMSQEVQTALLSIFEQWDGSGPNGLSGESVPITSRIVYATSLLEAFHRAAGRQAAIRLAEQRKGKAFDPSVVDAFLRLSQADAFWEGLEQESAWAAVLAMEPPSAHRYLPVEKLEDVAVAFADFADLKSFYTTGHSRRVGDLAEGAARQMRLAPEDVTTIRRAALMHDIGLVAVPSFVLHKPRARLTAVEWESLRLHPYHGERILARLPVLEPVVPLVGAHHERTDGSGYYRSSSAAQLPLGARIIAVADHFDELTHETPDHPALDPEEAIKRMHQDTSHGLCPTAAEALERHLGADASRRKLRPRGWPAGLSDREVEILRLLARGLSRRAMAGQLYLSEHTVRHHLEHIYNKIGVSTRVGATLFAVEHDLLN